MRLASVTKSQLSCLRSALESVFLQAFVLVAVVVVVIGWGVIGLGFYAALLKAHCVILRGNLCSQQQAGFLQISPVAVGTVNVSGECLKINACVYVCVCVYT